MFLFSWHGNDHKNETTLEAAKAWVRTMMRFLFFLLVMTCRAVPEKLGQPNLLVGRYRTPTVSAHILTHKHRHLPSRRNFSFHLIWLSTQFSLWSVWREHSDRLLTRVWFSEESCTLSCTLSWHGCSGHSQDFGLARRSSAPRERSARRRGTPCFKKGSRAPTLCFVCVDVSPTSTNRGSTREQAKDTQEAQIFRKQQQSKGTSRADSRVKASTKSKQHKPSPTEGCWRQQQKTVNTTADNTHAQPREPRDSEEVTALQEWKGTNGSGCRLGPSPQHTKKTPARGTCGMEATSGVDNDSECTRVGAWEDGTAEVNEVTHNSRALADSESKRRHVASESRYQQGGQLAVSRTPWRRDELPVWGDFGGSAGEDW